MSTCFNQQNAYNQYRTAAVQTANPGKLLLMLFDGLVVALKQAKTSVEKSDHQESNRLLMKGQDILSELMATLNMDYEISASLYSLYDYLRQRLMQANISKDVAVIEEVLGFAIELRSTWADAVKATTKIAATR